MKHLKTFTCLIAIACIISTTIAQTVEQVVAKNIAALGGVDKLKTIHTIHMQGAMGNGVEIDIIKSHLTGVRMTISAAGITGYQINTPKQGWDSMPFQGPTTWQAWTQQRVQSSLPNLDIQGIFLNYKEKGIKLELAGKEKADSIECYKIKASTTAGSITHYFLSTATYLLIKTSTSAINNMGEAVEIETTFSNFNKTTSGFTFPYSISTPSGNITFTSIEVNIPVDAKIFSPN